MSRSSPAALRRHIARLGLSPHPEGGWYREIWRAEDRVDSSLGSRPAATCILFLLGGGAISRLHRLAQDEIWCHHDGPGLDLHVFDPGDGRHQVHALGRSVLGPAVVPAGAWMGAEAPAGWGLVSCVCAPGFDFSDLLFAQEDDMKRWFEDHTLTLRRLMA